MFVTQCNLEIYKIYNKIHFYRFKIKFHTIFKFYKLKVSKYIFYNI